MAIIKTPRVCVPLCAKNIVLLRELAHQATLDGDLIELRLDCLNEISQIEIDSLVESLTSPVILTLRPAEQGGGGSWSVDERIDFWTKRLCRDGSELFDIEMDLALLLAQRGVLSDWSRIVCSHHDFNGVPADLEDIYVEISKTPAAVIKIAAQARDVVDCLPLFRLIDRARTEGREVIAIAMGNAGIATRILGPSRGGFLSYGALEDETATAPGQLSARTLRSLYRFGELTADTQVFGLVGSPVMHSLSPHIHNAAFAATRVDGVYIPFEVTAVDSFFERMVHPATREFQWRIRGLSITAPHKFTVVDRLDWIDPLAKEIGAVNTVIVTDDELRGYNTDAAGLIQPLLKRLRSLKNARVAVLGAGGAANAAVFALLKESAQVTVFSRNPRAAQHLCKRFNVSSAPLHGASYHDYDIVINATPLGTKGELQDQSPALSEQLRGTHLVYDLIYNPSETSFMREGRAAGCDVLGGLEMLVSQAAMQFTLWTNLQAPLEVMQEAAAKALDSMNRIDS